MTKEIKNASFDRVKEKQQQYSYAHESTCSLYVRKNGAPPKDTAVVGCGGRSKQVRFSFSQPHRHDLLPIAVSSKLQSQLLCALDLPTPQPAASTTLGAGLSSFLPLLPAPMRNLAACRARCCTYRNMPAYFCEVRSTAVRILAPNIMRIVSYKLLGRKVVTGSPA